MTKHKMAYHFEVRIKTESLSNFHHYADQERREQFLSNYGKVTKADAQKLYAYQFYDPRGEVYEFWIEGKKVGREQFREEVDKVYEANWFADRLAWAGERR
jgi:hypothetical protein